MASWQDPAGRERFLSQRGLVAKIGREIATSSCKRPGAVRPYRRPEQPSSRRRRFPRAPGQHRQPRHSRLHRQISDQLNQREEYL
jgi:hypothetical protein